MTALIKKPLNGNVNKSGIFLSQIHTTQDTSIIDAPLVKSRVESVKEHLISMVKLRSRPWKNMLQARTDALSLNYISIKNYADTELIKPKISEL